MKKSKMLRGVFACFFLLAACLNARAQTKTVSGKVVDEKGSPVSNATIAIKGAQGGATSQEDGTFSVHVPAGATTIEVAHVGFVTQDVVVTDLTTVNVTLKEIASDLNEVIVVGYGTAKKKDLTGAVTTVGTKDFNKGVFASPDQLVQGKVSGVQIINNSGQPGGAATVRIRGNSALTGTGSPLYVVDGILLDGRSARPAVNVPEIGTIPGGNALNFINPSDIANITVLKDASATAIYGSRAAYGVILIETKKGNVGQPKLDISSSVGTSAIMKKIKMLNGDEYRAALNKYDLGNTNDKGGDVDALSAILRNGITQNYNIGISGGNENGKYRISTGLLNQQGIVRKSDFKKYSFNFGSSFKFLENKRLGLDINLIANQYLENIPPITNDAGFGNSLIGQALQWNPTESLYNTDGSFNIKQGSAAVNPVALQKAYNDKSRVTTILGSIAPSYKLTDDLTYKMLYSINYSSGIRRTAVDGYINFNTWGANVDYPNGLGYAAINNAELITQQVTHTLNYVKKITKDLDLNALVGYEYMKFTNKGSGMSGTGPKDGNGFGNYGLDLTNYIQYSNAAGRTITSYADPNTELQSYFGRLQLNYKGRYMLTGTLRSDGSTRFGSNNKYGLFPSFAGAWDISNEDFFHKGFVSNLKLRAGWGKTGNQEFASGASQTVFAFGNSGSLNQTTNANPDLKWQADKQYNIGLDFAILNNRISATVDYFNKTTSDLLFPNAPIQPAAAGAVATWYNLPGKVLNKGWEVMVNASVVKAQNISWDISLNAGFLKNRVSGMPAPIYTGQLNGQGVSGTLVEIIANGLPMNAFYTRTFNGIDPATGQSIYPYGDSLSYQGDPNPHQLLGFSTTLTLNKFTLTANLNGAFGYKIYNNTFNNVVNISNLRSGRNVASEIYNAPVQEALSNRITSSSRFLENGNYLKMTNLTASYNFGNVGNFINGLSAFVTGQNLFVITKFKGFDPEVNTDKSSNGIPSRSIEYQPYPTPRTFTFGVNFSL